MEEIKRRLSEAALAIFKEGPAYLETSSDEDAEAMTKETFSNFNAADYLKTEEAVEAFLAEARLGGDADHIARAEETAKRARESIERVKVSSGGSNRS